MFGGGQIFQQYAELARLQAIRKSGHKIQETQLQMQRKKGGQDYKRFTAKGKCSAGNSLSLADNAL